MTVVAYFAESLDGFVADADGGMDWLYSFPNPSGSDHGYGEFIAGVDVVVIGRGTFDSVVDLPNWPYSLPVVVLTSRPVPDGLPDVEVASGTPAEVLALTASRGWDRVYVDGGQVVTSFLEADLLDELVVHRLPVVLGSGIRMFGDLTASRSFEHVATEVFDGTMVRSRYRRVTG